MKTSETRTDDDMQTWLEEPFKSKTLVSIGRRQKLHPTLHTCELTWGVTVSMGRVRLENLIVTQLIKNFLFIFKIPNPTTTNMSCRMRHRVVWWTFTDILEKNG